jgi:GNAT superfamily N-acetyltransferase
MHKPKISRKSLEIERIYVLKDFLGQKIGQILLNKAIEIGKKRT